MFQIVRKSGPSFAARIPARGPLHLTLSTSTLPSRPYVHPLSQIVLNRLQNNHSSFLRSVNLDSTLKLRSDGTFTLSKPSEDTYINTIWDSEERKHFLNVKVGERVGRYCLQDNTKPAWHGSKLSPAERIESAVDEMVVGRGLNDEER
ncbi:hypothetical protein TrLO_g15095 [Triparma laevis f. longispina]|uniref:Uncharacterized protein n=1 Tax=Triparma laevis f. longispina TaxID=1714387 RepID=A0A9W7AAA0_9STRA|nr:hypothetical protein TrLO_g15095 [Triparma laevis f. longispina]